ncbi:OmpA family protein [Verrucomicrobiaceae bacterium R5-34]|uniref:OmpA family protein n=1 Tax=Oceaniferula flava TaxID=2800421 RepID=A0AAE2SCE8_9BACT|nr:OmpA family protein [Oceaniferula flavus]MBK1829744.1 OmpA family protein [Verrucomicrobiaceae bacterium R5-34]MBK1853930.1 OmpA family protein [Oceaniferula flavus]MBM1135236.1 OmpA family protein [Oceaniferula flavus]
MQEEYSWNGGNMGSSSYRLPENEGQGKWVIIAIVFAVALHVIVLLGLSRIDVILPEFVQKKEIRTEVIRVNPVDTQDARPEVTPPEQPEIEEPVAVVPPADELDILENLPEMEIDIKPDIETIQVPKISSAAIGELEGETKEPMKATVFDPELPEMGKTEDFFPRADDSQVAVDPGSRMAEKYDPDAYTETLRKGAGGEAEDGLLKGFTTLDQMANMDGNSLLTTKALIGSDLLFEFNSAELKESAKVSLMKVAMLIYKHPNLVCWLDGHTDLIGGQESNLKLSRARANAVKHWLVHSMELSEDQIAVRGFGKSQPLVKEGTAEQQAPNRRVEIKMRKGHPEKPVLVKPKKPKPSVAESTPPVKPKPPKAIVEPEPEPSTNRAQIVPEDPAPPRAIPVEE